MGITSPLRIFSMGTMGFEPGSKGQIFSSDLIGAAIVVLILLAFIAYIWDDTVDDITRRLEVNELKHLALGISDSLVMTSGTPQDWATSPGNATAIGLAQLPHQLSGERWNAFAGLTYEAQKEKLGVGRFEFWAAIKSTSGATLNSTGSEPVGDYRIGLSRAVTYNNEPCFLNFILWEDYLTNSIPAGGYWRV